jgi:NAD+ diphosphatase
MQNAQSVVFGGSGLDRAAQLRGRPEVLDAALADGAPVLPVWRGKPLIAGVPGEGEVTLAFRDDGHPVLAEADEAPVLLGPGRGGGPGLRGRCVGLGARRCRRGAGRRLHRPQRADPPVRGRERRGLRRAAGDHGGADAARRGAGGDGARGAAMARHASPLRPLRRREPPGSGRVAAALPDLRRGAFPAHRPGRHHADHRWRQGPGRPVPGLARADVFAAGRVRGAGRDGGGRRAPGGAGGIRRPRGARALPRQPALAVSRVPHAGLPRRCGDDEITVDPEELDDARWVGRSEMLEVFMGRHPGIAGARKGAIAHFLLQAWLADRLDPEAALPPRNYG